MKHRICIGNIFFRSIFDEIEVYILVIKLVNSYSLVFGLLPLTD